MSFEFRTKAETLVALQPCLRSARVPPSLHFSLGEWEADRQGIVARLAQQPWSAGPLIVRSSARGEDSVNSSQAGAFLSCAGVALAEVADAVEAVAASYAKGARQLQADDRVLIQPMLPEVVSSGVAFTRDPATGAPYLVVNICDGSDTAAITGGSRGGQCYYHATAATVPAQPFLTELAALADELERLCRTDALDIEFAFTADGTLWLLQVRPLVMGGAAVDREAHAALLRGVEAKVAEAVRPHPFLHGSRTVFGVMPDWNPAEIIGVRPSPLALSLYRELVTDSIWAYQRHNYGYKNLRSFPLLHHFHGLPYVDVRVSFNSFVPRTVDGDLAERLVDYYIARLTERPALHDKVEFEIVLSAYAFDIDARMDELARHGFSQTDRDALCEALRLLTNRIINRRSGLWLSDSEKLNTLAERRQVILDSDLAPVAKIYWLLEDCKRYGTLPFAGLARAGFVAVQLLRSLRATGVFSQADYDAFMGTLETIGSEISRDSVRLTRDQFLAKFGHLRPGTYDIRAPRYDEAPEMFGAGGGGEAERPRFALSLAQLREIETMLARHGLENDIVGLFDFLQAAIEGRERAKFIFTRNLSDAMRLLADFGDSLGFSREDLAFANIDVIRELHASCADPRAVLAEAIERGRERHAATRSIVLPALITRPEDVWSFRMLDTEPNYITLGAVTAPVADVGTPSRLAGAIVCIPSADPGFDWIFSHGIGGLITAYGGANSHMAIRANELGIPAVIGAGETLYGRWSRARQLRIDCANRMVTVLS
ncbi:MAG TPA: PEP/pyruvate-binding domain-containing protein [Magnetospirillum sp.]|nr:PEP/pyruvate-binding domain-containing protein [Magnetospirillum sp.]